MALRQTASSAGGLTFESALSGDGEGGGAEAMGSAEAALAVTRT